MRSIELGEEIFGWNGDPEIISNPYYKILVPEDVRIIEVIVNEEKKYNGIILLGQVKAIIDSILYTNSHGAIGDTIRFSGNNLVIFGLPIHQIIDSIKNVDLKESEIIYLREEAEIMLSKLKKAIEDKRNLITLDTKKKDESEYIIFGKRNFLLISSEKSLVLINRKQISIREGDHKLVQIDPINGILIAENDKVLNIGGSSKCNFGTLLSELGLNIASSVLNHLIWD